MEALSSGTQDATGREYEMRGGAAPHLGVSEVAQARFAQNELPVHATKTELTLPRSQFWGRYGLQWFECTMVSATVRAHVSILIMNLAETTSGLHLEGVGNLA